MEIPWEAIREKNLKSMEFIARDAKKVVANLKKTNLQQGEDEFSAHIVESTLFINSFGMASKAFNIMIEEMKDKQDGERRSMAEIFIDLSLELKSTEMVREAEMKKLKEQEVDAIATEHPEINKSPKELLH